MEDYQRRSYDSTLMPGIGTYLKKIIEQNEKIIQLMERNNYLLENFK